MAMTELRWLVLGVSMMAANVSRASAPVSLTDNGAWCWFQDERALVVDNQLVATHIDNKGTVHVSTLDLDSGGKTTTVLRENFDADDHNVPGMLVRADGHLMAFYARHHRENRMFYRVSARPRDGRDWGPGLSYDAGVTDKFTYTNPFQLSAENGRIYNFWRGIDFNPTVATSDDNGRTWGNARNIIYYKKGQRPYAKYASNGVETIHFAFGEGHPAQKDFDNSLYHAFYRDGKLHRSDGSVIRPLAEGPATPTTRQRCTTAPASRRARRGCGICTSTAMATPSSSTQRTRAPKTIAIATPAGTRTRSSGATTRSRTPAVGYTSASCTTPAASASTPTTSTSCTSRPA